MLEYFVSTHGARKGLADTALRTADAGYLTRRLVDVAQDVIVRDIECGTTNGIWVASRDREAERSWSTCPTGSRAVPPSSRSSTRKRARSSWPTGEADHGRARRKRSRRLGIKQVGIRSPFYCELRQGICAQCYGRDLATGKLVEVGTAVGIIAAQSIGEPGTQLTMRTFHTGGVAGEYLTGVAEVKKKKQETLKQLHDDIEQGHGRLGEESGRAGAREGGPGGAEGAGGAGPRPAAGGGAVRGAEAEGPGDHLGGRRRRSPRSRAPA